MACSLFPENRDLLDQLPLKNIWSNSICNKYGVSNIPMFKYSLVVKNLNCIIVYIDILKYKNVTQDNCLLNGIFCELFILKFRLKQANISLRLQYFLVATVQTLPDLIVEIKFKLVDSKLWQSHYF